MACREKHLDYRDNKKSKTQIEEYAYEALDKFYTMIDEIEPWKSKRADHRKKIRNHNYDHRSVRTGEPDSSLETDKLIEEFIVDSASKVVRTIDDLSVELGSVTEKNDRFRSRNEILETEIDRLRSIIRISSGNSAEYRERVSEFKRIVIRAERETGMLKRSLENDSLTGEDRFATYKKRIESVETSINELARKLRNDREAMLAIERPPLSEYLKRIDRLEVCSDDLIRQLSRTGEELRARSCGIESSDTVEYPKIIGGMEKIVKHVSHELKSLKSLPSKIGTRIGGESCVRYLKRIENLERLVASSLSIVDELIADSVKVPPGKRMTASGEAEEEFRNFAESRDRVEALESLAKRLKSGIRGLEISVASGDSAKLIRRIRESERSARRLRNELAARDETNGSLSLELTGARIAYDEKVVELAKLRKRYDRATRRMKKRGIDLENEDSRIESLRRELEESRSKSAEVRSLRDEVDRLKPEVANLRSERIGLVEEMTRLRAAVEERDDRLARITKRKEAVELALAEEEIEARRRLVGTLEEIESLRRNNLELKNDLQNASKRSEVVDTSTDCEIGFADAEEAIKESERLRTMLDRTTDDLEATRNEFAVLNEEFKKLATHNAMIDLELSRTKIQNEALIVRLDSEKSTTSETLRNYDKLMIDFRLLNSDIESLTIERSSIRNNLEETVRERDAAIAEIEEVRRENSSLRNEMLIMKMEFDKLTLDLGASCSKNEEVSAQLKNLEDEILACSTRLELLTRKNEDLQDELDRARSDKLDVAGALNDYRLKYEESIDLSNSKIVEVKELQERLSVALRDSDESTSRETSARLEAARLLEENSSLRETIDFSNGEKRRLEERLENLDNEYRAVKNRLSLSENENKRLEEEWRTLKLKADELMADLDELTIGKVKGASESLDLVAEREKADRTLRTRLDEFDTARETLKIELSRLRDENASLKSERDRMTDEMKKIRLRGGGKKNSGESYECAKGESTRSRVADTGIDVLEIELGKCERDKLCAEIVALRTENCKMRMVLNKLRVASKKLEEQRNLLKITNDMLRGDLEDAKNEIADGDGNSREYRERIDDLMMKLEELKERNKMAARDAETMRSLNEKLDRESGDLRKYLESTKMEDQALRQEIVILRSALERVNDDNAKRRSDFAETEEELEALKVELSRVREENDSLRNELDARRSECRRLESEYRILEGELEELKRFRILAEAEGNELRGEYEKLKVLKVKVEDKLTDALREIGKYSLATAKLNGLENKLKRVLGDYVATKKLLRSANDEVNHLRRIVESCTMSVEYREKNKNPRDAITVSGV